MISGVISIVVMLAGLVIGAKWAEWFQNRGDAAGAYRVILYTRLIAMPFAMLMPVMPTPELALAFNAVGFLTLAMSGPMLNAVMLAITPNQIRGQVMTLYLFIYTVVGVGLAPWITGLFLGAKWAEWFQNRGDPAGAYRVILYTRLLAIPFAVLMPVMPTAGLSMAFNAIGFLTLGMSGPMLNAVMLAITPNQVRGQVMTLYLFIYTVVAVGLAPWITGLTTDYVFTSPDDLRWSLMLLHAVFMPLALVVTWLGVKPYRAEVERLNAEDAASGKVN
jgi:hypothetical protein